MTPLAGMVALGAAFTIARLNAKHNPNYANDNHFYWVQEDGSFGTRKPLNMGDRRWIQLGRALVPDEVRWNDFPEGENYIILENKEDVKEVRGEIARRWTNLMQSYVENEA